MLLALALVLATLAPLGGAPSAAAASTLGEVTVVARSMRQPYALAAGPDGNVWFRHRDDTIGRVAPDGTVTFFPAAGADGDGGIASGPDGNVWYTSARDHLVGRITPAGVVTTFTDAGLVTPTDLVTGPDGNLWFTDPGNDTVGRVTPGGVLSRFGDVAITGPTAIASDGAGALWFANHDSIGRITTAGQVVTTFATTKLVEDLVVGPDGNVWYTTGVASVGRLTPAGAETVFPAAVHPPSDTPTRTFGIAVGPDDALWVTHAATAFDLDHPQVNRGWIARYDTGGAVLGTSDHGVEDPRAIATGPDGNVWTTSSPAFNAYTAGRGGPGFISSMTPTGELATPARPALSGPLTIAGAPGGAYVLDQRGTFGLSPVRYGALSSVLPDGDVTEVDDDVILDVATTPGGDTWFVAYDLADFSNHVGRITPAGVVTTAPAGWWDAGVAAAAVEADATGGAWFAMGSGIFRADPDGTIHLVAADPDDRDVRAIAPAPDGSAWIAFEDGALSRLTEAGDLEAFGTGGITSLATGADGNAWATTTGAIVRVEADGDIDTFTDPDHHSLEGIVAGPDGHLWVSDFATGAVLRVDLAGGLEVVATITSSPLVLTAGGDGQVWYLAGGQVGTIGTALAAPAAAIDVHATAGIDRATVTWDATGPDEQRLGARYTVTASPGGRTCVRVSGPLTCTVTGLDLGVDHSFTVTASNGAGTAAASDPSPLTRTHVADMPAGAPFLSDVTWLVNRRIAGGYPDGTFRPTAPVTRQAMAAFLYRRAGRPDGIHPACAEAPFPDVPVDAPFCGEIAWLASTGVATGFADGTFRPAAPVSRQAMAAFLHRIAGSPGGPAPACSSPPFDDVPTGAPFCGQIAWLASTGITTGYDDGFRPDVPVSRGAMAAFLHRLAIEVP